MILGLALDVGCGGNDRYRFRTLIPIGYEPVFLDIEKPNPSLKKLGHWVIADAQYLPFRGNVFNLVILSHVLEHVDDPLKVLAETYRVLRSSGITHIRVPNWLSINARNDPEHKHIFNIFKLRRLLRRVGYRYRLVFAFGSRLPRKLRNILSLIANIFVEELVVEAVKP